MPHVLVGSRSFHQREGVETLRAALTAIEWPDDELSVYATLRGSLFWVRDALLLRFRDEFGSLYPFRPIPESLEADLSPVAAGGSKHPVSGRRVIGPALVAWAVIGAG